MEDDYTQPPEHPIWDQARALEATVSTIRRAQGKLNPQDCEPGTPAFDRITREFLRDLVRAMDADPHDTPGDAGEFGVGASG